jgi:YVTN family beta-propeller protein/VCBS repeat-containing protein
MASAAAVTDQQSTGQALTPHATLSASSAASAPQVPARTPQVQAPAPVSAPVTLSSVVSDVLHWLGLGPLAGIVPVPAIPLPPPLDLLWVALRRVASTFDNQTPTTAYNPVHNSQTAEGVVTGTLNAADFEGNTLTYTITQDPGHGQVAVHPDGAFTYTPEAAFAHLGGTDSFTVTVDDRPGNPPHLHGLATLLAPDGGATTQATVTVSVAPVNHPPTLTVTPTGSANPDSGAIGYQVATSDRDGDTVRVSITDTPDHAVLAANTDGTYTYTPNHGFAHALGPDGTATDSFTLTADDFHGPTTSATQQVTVSFLNTAPTASTVIGNPHPQTGAVRFTVSGSDAEGDPVAINVHGDPATGNLSFENGAWTYTPSAAARILAASVGATEADKQDNVTFAVSDGYTAKDITVTIPVIPPSNAIIDTFVVSGDPRNAVVSPDGTRLYVTQNAYDAVAEVDTITGDTTPRYNFFGGRAPDQIAINPAGTRLYVTGHDDNGGTLSVIDAASGTFVVPTIRVGSAPSDVAVSPDGAHAYVSDYLDDSVWVIDTATNTVTATVPNVGNHPSEVAVSADSTRVYVVNEGDGSQSVIDASAHTVIGTIPAGSDPYITAVHPDGVHVYIPNYASNSLSVIDTTTNTLTAKIAHVGGGPLAVAFSRDGTHAYVINDDATVTVVSVLPAGAYSNTTPASTALPTVGAADPAAGTVAGSLHVDDLDGDTLTYTVITGPARGGVFVDAATGNWGYTPSQADRIRAGAYNATAEEKQVSFTITASDGYAATTQTVTVPVAPLASDTGLGSILLNDPSYYVQIPVGVAVSPDDARLYVSTVTVNHDLSFTRDILVIDTATRAMTSIPVGRFGNSGDLAASPDGARLYFASDGEVAVFDTATAAKVATVDLRSADGAALNPAGIAVSPDSARLYVGIGDAVWVIDAATYETIGDPIPAGNAVAGVAVNPDETRLYVTRWEDGKVSVIDIATKSVVRTIDVESPQGVVVSPDGAHIYVTNYDPRDPDPNDYRTFIEGPGTTASVIDTNTFTVLKTIAVPLGPEAVAVSSDGTLLYVVSDAHNFNPQDPNVTITPGSVYTIALAPIAPSAT